MAGRTRREILRDLGVALGAAALAGCGSDGGGGGADVDAAVPPPDASPPLAPHPAKLYTPDELLAPIETIVVLCMENRSFDHYLGSLSLAEHRAVDGLTGTEWNPDPMGAHVPVHQLDTFTPADPPHGWDESHAQWHSGKNDGFVIQHAGASQADVMGYHVRAQLPITYALADAGAVCDRWYASVMGPTWPNRFYLHAATSAGQKSNLPVTSLGTTMWDALAAKGITRKNYYHDVAWATGAFAKLTDLATIDTFFADATAGTLPQFALIDPHFFGTGANDDHPNHDARLGQALVASVYAALAQSPQWNKSLLVVTYDEHGGFFDHVSPPTTADPQPGFTQLGFRVPSIVLGPFARRTPVHTRFEHVSVISTLVRRFGLTPWNPRIGLAADLSSCIDPATLDNPRPPVTLPPVPIPRLVLDQPGAAIDREAELWQAAEAGLIPPELDRRAQSREIAEAVLQEGVRLGVVELI